MGGEHAKELGLNGPLDVFRGHVWSIVGVIVFSAAMNILGLTGSLYALQLYDRVLPSRSEPTLVGLTVLALGLLLAFGLLDLVRGRLLARIGIEVGREIEAAAFEYARRSVGGREGRAGSEAIHDADRIRSFLSGLGATALFDLPWVPLFVVVIYFIHPVLGLFALISAVVLIVLAVGSEALSQRPLENARVSRANCAVFVEEVRRAGHRASAIAPAKELQNRFDLLSMDYARHRLAALDATQTFSSVVKVSRLVMQAGIMGLGAWLVVRGEVTGGAMIASSVIMARALAPIDTITAHARSIIAARSSWHRLARIRRGQRGEALRIVSLPRPSRTLCVEALTLVSPGTGTFVLRDVSFSLAAGDGLGIIGHSGSGKSSLVQALIGGWAPGHVSGTVRLDGVILDDLPAETWERDIGYLPQEVDLIGARVDEFISRFDPACSSNKVLMAAELAGVHDIIVRLPQGYETPIGAGGVCLSAGQRQRLALARALYGDPFLVVLDEPNSNLDREGEAALNEAVLAVRQRGGIAIVVAHRTSALQSVDRILALANGQLKALGPKQLVLRGVHDVSTPSQRGPVVTGQHAGLKARVMS